MQNNDRYLIQFWANDAKRYITDCAFQDSKKQHQKALAYLSWVMAGKNSPSNGRIYDMKKRKIIHQINNS